MSEGEHSALRELKTRAQEFGVSVDGERILEELVKAPTGWRLSEVGELSRRARVGREECLTELWNLQRLGLLADNDADPDAPFLLNYAQLNIAEERFADLQRSQAYGVLGAPREEDAQEGLSTLFGHQRATVYVALGATDPDSLQPDALAARAASGLRTVLIVPLRRHVLHLMRRAQYREMLRQWEDFVKQHDSGRCIELRITLLDMWFLHTSALTQSKIRFTVYSKEETASFGDMIEADSDTSLYEAGARLYREALTWSLPWWRHRPVRAAFELVWKSWFYLFIPAAWLVGALVNEDWVWELVGLVSASVLAIGVRLWGGWKRNLFKS